MASCDITDAEINAILEDDVGLPPVAGGTSVGVLTQKAPEPTPKKRHGRPSLHPGVGDPESTWTASMTEILIEQKQNFAKMFADARNKDSVQMGWSRLTLSVNTLCKSIFSFKQVKDKYTNLRKMYRKIRESENETGNKKAKKKPDYWDALNNHFGGRQGAAHSALLYDEEDEGEGSSQLECSPAETCTPPAKTRKVAATDRLTAVASVGADIKEGLESLGDKLIVAMATPAREPDMDLLTAIKFQGEQIQKTNELLQVSNSRDAEYFDYQRVQNGQLMRSQNLLLEAMTKFFQK